MKAKQHEPIQLTTDGELVRPQPVAESAPDDPVLEPSPNESATGQAIRNTLHVWAPVLLSLLSLAYFICFVLNPALALTVLILTVLLFVLYYRHRRARVTSKRIGGMSQFVERFFKDLKYLKLPGPGRW